MASSLALYSLKSQKCCWPCRGNSWYATFILKAAKRVVLEFAPSLCEALTLVSSPLCIVLQTNRCLGATCKTVLKCKFNVSTKDKMQTKKHCKVREFHHVSQFQKDTKNTNPFCKLLCFTEFHSWEISGLFVLHVIYALYSMFSVLTTNIKMSRSQILTLNGHFVRYVFLVAH